MKRVMTVLPFRVSFTQLVHPSHRLSSQGLDSSLEPRLARDRWPAAQSVGVAISACVDGCASLPDSPSWSFPSLLPASSARVRPRWLGDWCGLWPLSSAARQWPPVVPPAGRLLFIPAVPCWWVNSQALGPPPSSREWIRRISHSNTLRAFSPDTEMFSLLNWFLIYIFFETLRYSSNTVRPSLEFHTTWTVRLSTKVGSISPHPFRKAKLQWPELSHVNFRFTRVSSLHSTRRMRPLIRRVR